jgi:glycosyltransferase involved in cell wall biosynthesis
MTVSITIPCRNEERYIGKCLQSIVNCNYSKSLLEVFVCDGMSDDQTVSIINKFVSEHPYIHILENKLQTTQYALNMGLKASDADIKIILGAHSEIYPDYIDKCIEAFAIHPDIGCVGGLLENVMEDENSAVISMAMSSSFGVGNAHFRTGGKDGYVDTVAFGAYKNEVFAKAGYFDEDLVRNQDDEFNFRLIKHGYKIYLSHSIRAKYYVRASFRKLYRQYFQYGYWKVFVNKKHRVITTLRQIVPAFFVLFIFTGLVLSLLHPYITIAYLSVLFLYLLLGLRAAREKSAKTGVMTKIAFTFFLLHWSYGTGYLKGIWNFIILQRKKASSQSSTLSR